MIKYVSTLGGDAPIDFEQAILNGRPADGGLYVPTFLPKVSIQQLQAWKSLSYTELAFEILSLFIDRSVIPAKDLKELLEKSFSTFFDPGIIPIHPLSKHKGVYIQELFHGPTLSFKDVAMGFVVNLFNYFLQKRGEKMSLVVATSGDTGPAAAFACANKKTLDAWVLYPSDLITEEQVRQMTCLQAPNIYAVGVSNCPDGSDDLDDLIASLFANEEFKQELNLSSVNSINWGRVMMQTVHYFYGYLQMVDEVGDPLIFSVPSGAFGNLCAGSLAREMGLPVHQFLVANNQNGALARIFSEGNFTRGDVIPSHSSAIDITVPLNFWRYLYFAIGKQPGKIKAWQQAFEAKGQVHFDADTLANFSKGYATDVISDQETLDVIREVYQTENYLLDPHGAVAVAAAKRLNLPNQKVLCLATAHPCKFSDVIQQALGELPKAATHPSIEAAKGLCQRVYTCDFKDMYEVVPNTMRTFWR